MYQTTISKKKTNIERARLLIAMPCQRPQNTIHFYGGLFIVSLNGNIIINDFEHTNKYVILSTVNEKEAVTTATTPPPQYNEYIVCQ